VYPNQLLVYGLLKLCVIANFDGPPKKLSETCRKRQSKSYKSYIPIIGVRYSKREHFTTIFF
jgi:hypothetical protein